MASFIAGRMPLSLGTSAPLPTAASDHLPPSCQLEMKLRWRRTAQQPFTSWCVRGSVQSCVLQSGDCRRHSWARKRSSMPSFQRIQRTSLTGFWGRPVSSSLTFKEGLNGERDWADNGDSAGASTSERMEYQATYYKSKPLNTSRNTRNRQRTAGACRVIGRMESKSGRSSGHSSSSAATDSASRLAVSVSLDRTGGEDGGLDDLEDRERPSRGRRRWTGKRLRALSRLLLWRFGPRALGRAIRSFLRTNQWFSMLGLFALGMAAFTALSALSPYPPPPSGINYSTFVSHVDRGYVRVVKFEEGSHRIFFNFNEQGQAHVKAMMAEKAALAAAAAASRTQDQTSSKDAPAGSATSSPAGSLTGAEVKTAELPSAALQPSSVQGVAEVKGGSDGAAAAAPDASLSRSTSATKATGAKRGLTLKLGKAEVLLSMSEPKADWEYVTRKVANDEGYLLGLMRTHDVKYYSAPRPIGEEFRSLLTTVVSLWIPLSPLLWLLSRQLGGSGSGRKRRGAAVAKGAVKFEDVAGVDAAKAELMEVVACLKGSAQYKGLGAKLPRGVLLVGPPGTGKTLLARAVAGEAGVPFFATSAGEFVELFVGRGAARVRELFAEARKATPSVVFIDELDAVGGRRGTSFNDERDQTLNQLLTEMDGFEGESGVLVLAATNRPEALDPALCRPGRISRRVFVGLPDREGREQILAVHMRKVPVEGDVETVQRTVAMATAGCSGADLANIVNEAALLAGRNGRQAVALEDFVDAIQRFSFGIGRKQGGLSKTLAGWLGQLASTTGTGKEPKKDPPNGYRGLAGGR